jgi:hypothetical protein
MRTRLPAVLVTAILFPLALTCDVAESLTLREVLKRMDEQDGVRFALLRHYTCLRRYVLNNHRFHATAELDARVSYTYPGYKVFEVLSERGPSVIRQRVLRRMLDEETQAGADDIREQTRIAPSNYEFRLLNVEIQQGRPSYVLEVTPKAKNKFSISGRVWIDSEDFAIVRVEGSPARNPSALIRNTHVVQQYQKLGQVWVPLFNHSASDSLLFGRTEVTIDSSDYDITQNSGSSGKVLCENR